VFQVNHVVLEHKNYITDVLNIQDKIVSYSSVDQQIVITDLASGKVIISKIGVGNDQEVIAGIAKGSRQFKDKLLILTFKQTDKQYDLSIYS
jgi:hypothetical protein